MLMAPDQDAMASRLLSLGGQPFISAVFGDMRYISEQLGTEGSRGQTLADALESEHGPEHLMDMARLQARLGTVLLYLVSDRADVPEGTSELRDAVVRRERQGIRNFQAGSIRKWEVGFRVGAQIRDFNARESGSATGLGTTVRPHVRKAHWHAFWTGPRDKPEERKKKVRWLPPIPVNVEQSDDLVPTLRRVVREII